MLETAEPPACSNLSTLDVGLGSIVAGRHFVVPATILVLVRDARRFSGHDLFLRRALRRPAGHVVGGKGLGEDPVHPIGPTAVMLDDLIGDLGHLSLLTPMNASSSTESAGTSSLEEEPHAPFSLVDPVLDQACGGHVSLLVAKAVGLTQIGHQLLVVVAQLGEHVRG